MSALVGMAPGNGRTYPGDLGPVPVPQQPGESRGATPPTEIMARRRAREARRREEERHQREQEAEAQRQAQAEAMRLEEDSGLGGPNAGLGRDRRTSRRSEGRISSSGIPITSAGERRPGERGSGGSAKSVDAADPAGYRAPFSAPQDPTSMKASNSRDRPVTAGGLTDIPQNVAASRNRPRGATLSTGQPIPVSSQPTAQRAVSGPPLGSMDNEAPQTKNNSRTGASQSRLDRPTGAIPRAQSSSNPLDATNRSNTSSFPHAFERWEQLSSHWEGLTSFWIRRLEQNREDLDREPLNQQMARQVTDLSAAGANLFHAVVELQRLRASSERKFQRWFFETRADQERARETQAQLEEQIRSERQARSVDATTTARFDDEIKAAHQAKTVADVQVKEMRRELAISKDEARRAWEELGRREQEERERTKSLRDGQITVVGGLQVVPMRTSNSRTAASDGSMLAPSAPLPVQVEASPIAPEPRYTTYNPAASDTDTDPFTEAGRMNAALPPLPSGGSRQAAPPSQPSSLNQNPPRQHDTVQQEQPRQHTSTTTTTTTIPTGGGNNTTTTTTNPSTATYLHYGPDMSLPASSTSQPALPVPGSFYHHPPTATTLFPHTALQEPYSPSPSPSSSGRGDDAEGPNYGTGSGWEQFPPRHHHPTRLSDVLEEDERSRTSMSRASQGSRGIRP